MYIIYKRKSGVSGGIFMTPDKEESAITITKETIEMGLDYILSHFQLQEIWPRTISTKTTEGRQVPISSKEEALARFKQANWLDCRISAYPLNATENPSIVERFQGLTCVTPRNLVVIIDLDKSTLKSERVLDVALTKTLQNIKSALSVEPTVIWSGNGYHIYLAMDSEDIILESVEDFLKLKVDKHTISVKFLRFAEWFLSNGKSDKAHNTTVSFNNCMLRIPGSINSKNNAQVTIIQEWNGQRSSIKPLLEDFYVY
jgi:hypothetical protein